MGLRLENGKFYQREDGTHVQVWVSDTGKSFIGSGVSYRRDGIAFNEGDRITRKNLVKRLPQYDTPVPIDSDTDEGKKNDSEKLPLHLIPPEFLYAIASILAFGAEKYAPRNWEKGINYSRVYRAAIGHLFKWFMRHPTDPETGKSHLWHAACCVMFLVVYELREMSQHDDRPQQPEKLFEDA